MNRAEIIQNAAQIAEISLNEEQIKKFSEYFDHMIEWNERINLTAITSFEEVAEKHFADSLVACKELDITQYKRIIDVGSGAGFPGIPLAIAFPGQTVTLLDSLNKRSDFQKEMKSVLGLDNLEIVNGRAEDVSRETSHREAYDLVVSRAVADLAVLAEYCLPFVRVGGLFVAYKGAGISDELEGAANAVSVLGGEIQSVAAYCLPESNSARNLVVLSKTTATPEKYPRRAGIPAKRPL